MTVEEDVMACSYASKWSLPLQRLQDCGRPGEKLFLKEGTGVLFARELGCIHVPVGPSTMMAVICLGSSRESQLTSCFTLLLFSPKKLWDSQIDIKARSAISGWNVWNPIHRRKLMWQEVEGESHKDRLVPLLPPQWNGLQFWTFELYLLWWIQIGSCIQTPFPGTSLSLCLDLLFCHSAFGVWKKQ